MSDADRLKRDLTTIAWRVLTAPGVPLDQLVKLMRCVEIIDQAVDQAWAELQLEAEIRQGRPVRAVEVGLGGEWEFDPQ